VDSHKDFDMPQLITSGYPMGAHGQPITSGYPSQMMYDYPMGGTEYAAPVAKASADVPRNELPATKEPADSGTDFCRMQGVRELLAYNFKQFGGLIKVVPRIFADEECRVRDLGQLVARAHFWLIGLRGKDRIRRTTLHNRFVEVFIRSWYERRRGEAILNHEGGKQDAPEDFDFLISKVTQFVEWAEGQNRGIQDDDAKLHLSLTSTLFEMTEAKNRAARAATPPKHDWPRDAEWCREAPGSRVPRETSSTRSTIEWTPHEFGGDDLAASIEEEWRVYSQRLRERHPSTRDQQHPGSSCRQSARAWQNHGLNARTGDGLGQADDFLKHTDDLYELHRW
jgi:hypothetical protein